MRDMILPVVAGLVAAAAFWASIFNRPVLCVVLIAALVTAHQFGK